MKRSHPSPAGPHWMFCSAEVCETHGPTPPSSAIGCPDTLNPPPPQKSGAWHEPQLRTPPHPSLFAPQLKPAAWHVSGVHGGGKQELSATATPPQLL